MFLFRKMKKKLIKLSLIAFMLFNSNAYSQSVPPAPNQRPGPGAPISGGIIILLAVGAVYGAKSIDKR